LELSKRDKEIADNLMERRVVDYFTFLINTHVLNNIPPKSSHYLILIDAFKAGLYNEIISILNKYKKNITSYRCVGEKDFACFYTGEESLLTKFLSEISELFIKVAVKPKKIIQCLELKSFFAGRKLISDAVSLDLLREQSNLAMIETYLKDYRKPVSPQFLSDIKNNNILVGYKIIYDFLQLKKFRVIIIVWSPVNIREFLIKREISEKVLEAYTFVKVIDGYGDTGDPETTYTDTQNVIICEFDNLNEYTRWMDDFYEYSTEINCLSVLIEDRISEIPITIGKYHEFEKIYKKYESNNGCIMIGNPIMYGSETMIDKDICLDMNVINRHGIICGIPGSGKTTTLKIIAEESKRKGLGVYIIDVERDEKFKEYSLIDNGEFIKGNISLINSKKSICRFDIKEENSINRDSIMIKLLDNILYLEETDQMEYLLLIDEFKSVLSENVLPKITDALDRARKRGVGIWCISQSLKHFQTGELYNQLRNKIIHQLAEDDIVLLKSILDRQNINYEIYEYGFEDSFLKLEKRQAYVTFVDIKDNLLKPLVKVQIKEEG